MKYLFLFSIVLSLALSQTDFSSIDDVSRKIVLDNQGYVEVTLEIKFKPLKGTNFYYHVIPRDYWYNIVDVKAVKMTNYDTLKVEKLHQAPALSQFSGVSQGSADDLIFYKVQLDEQDRDKKVVAIEVVEVYKKRVDPFPSTITIKEEQYVKYEDSKYIMSVYKVNKQKTTIYLDTRQMVSINEDDTLEKKSKQVSYGPFKDVEPLKFEFMRVHYQKNTALPIFTDSSRTIEISHWGNINIEEHFELFNHAAGIKGEFGRIDYNQYNPSDGKSAWKGISSALPRYIRGLYYYDYIGNISTSAAFRDQDKVQFDIDPRYPVFGQWKIDWNQGYNVPTRYHLFYDASKPDRYVFNYTFLHDYKEYVSENYTVRVILPEGATNIKVHVPFELDTEERDVYFSTLDYIGRPVVHLTKDNALGGFHDQYFQVSYTFANQNLFIEPIYLIMFIFVLFVFAIAYSRFDMHFDEKKMNNVKNE